MILDIFSELQKPDGLDESQLYADAIEQAKLADQLGYGCWWSVEHHGTGDFSHCSTPYMFLAVLSQHTERIHLGTAGTLAPHGIHHPLQIAESAAFLDAPSPGPAARPCATAAQPWPGRVRSDGAPLRWRRSSAAVRRAQQSAARASP